MNKQFIFKVMTCLSEAPEGRKELLDQIENVKIIFCLSLKF